MRSSCCASASTSSAACTSSARSPSPSTPRSRKHLFGAVDGLPSPERLHGKSHPRTLPRSLLLRDSSKAWRRGSGLSTVFSDVALDTLESRWTEQGRDEPRSPARAGGSSRAIDALVDRRFVYLGREAS